MNDTTEESNGRSKARGLATRTTAFFLPIILATAFLNAGQTQCGNCSTNCTEPPAPPKPEVSQIPGLLIVEVAGSIPAGTTMIVYRDNVEIGRSSANSSGTATYVDLPGLTGKIYSYGIRYYDAPDGLLSDGSPTAELMYRSLPPVMDTDGHTRPCGTNGDGLAKETFVATQVPTDATVVSLYLMDADDPHQIESSVASTTTVESSGVASVDAEVYWTSYQYSGERYEYRFAYVDSSGAESQLSEPAVVTIPYCQVTDWPGLQDGLKIGVYLVRFLGEPNPGEPEDPVTPSDVYEGVFGSNPHSATTMIGHVTRGALTVSGDVYGDGSPSPAGWIELPFTFEQRCAPACPTVGQDAADLASEVLAFIEQQPQIPAQAFASYDQHVIILDRWGDSGGSKVLPNISMLSVEMAGPDAAFAASGAHPHSVAAYGVGHEAITHASFSQGHTNEWYCLPPTDGTDVGPSFVHGEAGCEFGGSADFDLTGVRTPRSSLNGIILQRIGALLPGEVVEAESSGEYTIGHIASATSTKRLDIDLGDRFAYTFEYRVDPYAGTEFTRMVRAYLKPSMQLEPTQGNATGFWIKDLTDAVESNETTFRDPYRGIFVQVLETNADEARLQIDFFTCGNGLVEGPEECDDSVNDGTGPQGCLPECVLP